MATGSLTVQKMVTTATRGTLSLLRLAIAGGNGVWKAYDQGRLVFSCSLALAQLEAS